MFLKNHLELRVDGYTRIELEAVNGTAYFNKLNKLGVELVVAYDDYDKLMRVALELAGLSMRDVRAYAGLMKPDLKFVAFYRR